MAYQLLHVHEKHRNAKRGWRYNRTPAQRLWDNTQRAGEQDCWLWNGRKNHAGYGVMRVHDKTVQAHHVALEASGRPRPIGAVGMHLCDNPSCVNPAHLRWGTHSENAVDREAKRRGYRMVGSANGRAKVDEETVRMIRQSDQTATALSAQLGISISTVCSIRRGRLWPHVI